MDVIAGAIGMAPAEFRRRNLLRAGGQTATGQVVREGTDLASMQDRALALAAYDVKRTEHESLAASGGYLRRGIGFATFFHGAGFTGAGEVRLASEVWVEGLPDGTIEVLTAQTDMGQGTNTILTQIVADRLGLPPNTVRIATPDTSRVPNSGPTVASRTAMVVGRLLEQACDDLAVRAGKPAARGAALVSAIRTWHATNPSKRLTGVGKYVKPESIHWDEANYHGDAYADYSWATHVAEVEVDLRTYSVRVVDYVALQEIGKVLNPTLAIGQIQGGVVQGIGWALIEDVVLDDGAMKNCQMTNYIIPGSADLPRIRVFFDERASPFGPSGAKGIGELPIDGPAPAVINAVCDALDISVNEIPLTPEKLMVALKGRTRG
jgi:CO/xanthine dehydrogenase Mo-binding subunit